jgi:hypothetical protein
MSVLHNKDVTTDHRWIGYTSHGDNSHLIEEQRQLVDQRKIERQERRGALLAIVQVHVHENGKAPQVLFPPRAILKPDTDSSVISEVVNRARIRLGAWR